MNFDKAFKALIGHEGGYSGDRRDRGNWTTGVIGKGQLNGTKYGISAMSYPQIDIKNLTLGEAKKIYKRDYWDTCQADKLPEQIRFDVFDMAVNSGVRNAIKNIQFGAGVRADGFLGPKTKAAIACMDAHHLDKKMCGHRLRFMASIKSWPTFGKGWALRIANNLIND